LFVWRAMGYAARRVGCQKFKRKARLESQAEHD